MQKELTLSDLAVFEKPMVMYLEGYPADRLPIACSTDATLSMTQTFQLCVYYFLNPDSKHFILNVPIRPLAELIGCSLRTVKNNNRFFSDKLFISFTENKNHTVSLKLHIKEELVDEDVIILQKKLILQILEMDNVNSIRIAFRFILRLHDHNSGKIYYSYNDIVRFLPSNINHPKMIKQMVLALLDIFDIESSANGFFVSYKRVQ